jgi:putative PEP-CTERM system histidine kinase
MPEAAIWTVIGTFTHLAGVAALCVVAAWLLPRRARLGPSGWPVIGALGATALWAGWWALPGGAETGAELSETARNLAWLLVLYRLCSSAGEQVRLNPLRHVALALCLVALLQTGLLLIGQRAGGTANLVGLIFHISAMLRLLFVVGGLVLLHNLVAGSSGASRPALIWSVAAIAAAWLYDLNFYTTAYLAEAIPQQLAALRGLVPVVMAGLIAMGAKSGDATLRFLPSRSVAFQTASLAVIGGYLVMMVVAAQWLARSGADFAGPMQLAFVIAASVLAIVLLPSRRLRGWLKVSVAKHFFQHRYDYRAEWLRFTRTIGRGGAGAPVLEERVIQAVADITESTSGLLLTPGDDGELQLAARWNWPTIAVPSPALARQAGLWPDADGFIVEFDDLRDGGLSAGKTRQVPDWLLADHRSWALVPLLHFDRLIGAIVLARPVLPRRLDWEDFDLLRVVGQQLASYLAESDGQEALAEAGRFDEFNRRIAFVMHDIKNLASQLALLARNAELHAENPEFRADMMVTLRNSAEKLNTLLVRLSRYGGAAPQAAETISLDELAVAVAQRLGNGHQVIVAPSEPVLVTGHREGLDQAVSHLAQNAIEASQPDQPVFLSVVGDGLYGALEVLDSGHGMSLDFVRTKLFKPFVSSKQGGFGIGAYEARELVQAMGGRLDVESREGLGTRFKLRLPLASAAHLLEKFGALEQKVA